MKRKKIAILLDGPIKNDGRVRRIIESLSLIHNVDLYYIDGQENDKELFNKNVNLFSNSIYGNWITQNFKFQNKFKEIENSILKNISTYDIIYCNDYPLLALGVKLKKVNKRIKLIYDSHEIYIETINQFFPTKGLKAIYGKLFIEINKIYHSLQEKRLVKNIDEFITVCDSFKFYFEKKYDLRKIKVIKNFPRLASNLFDRNNLLREVLKLPNTSLILLYQGVLNKGRGLEKMIQACSLLNQNEHFVILGDGPIKNDLEQLKKDLNVSNVHFLEKVPFEKLLRYTASADIGILFIQPINKSKELTLPNKVFEYMAGSLFIFSNSLPESSNLIKEVNCGLILKNDDPKNIAEEITKISNNKKLLANGSNGKEAFIRNLNWEKQEETLLEVFK